MFVFENRGRYKRKIITRSIMLADSYVLIVKGTIVYE